MANTLRRAGVDLEVQFNKRSCFKEWTFKSSEQHFALVSLLHLAAYDGMLDVDVSRSSQQDSPPD